MLSDVAAIQTRADKKGDEYVISGSKTGSPTVDGHRRVAVGTLFLQ